MSMHEIRSERRRFRAPSPADQASDVSRAVNPAWAEVVAEVTPVIARLANVLRDALTLARPPVTALEALAKTDAQRVELNALADLLFEINQLTDWDHGVIDADGDWYAAWSGDADAIARIAGAADAVILAPEPDTTRTA
jgi:hypothetical protein